MAPLERARERASSLSLSLSLSRSNDCTCILIRNIEFMTGIYICIYVGRGEALWKFGWLYRGMQGKIENFRYIAKDRAAEWLQGNLINL